MTISISIDSIAHHILAQTALRHHLKADRPPLLTPDQLPALRRLIASGIAPILPILGPTLQSCSDLEPLLNPHADTCSTGADTSDTIITLDIDIPSSAVNPIVLRLAIEHALHLHAIAIAYNNSGILSQASSLTQAHAEALRAIAALTTPLPPGLTPYF